MEHGWRLVMLGGVGMTNWTSRFGVVAILLVLLSCASARGHEASLQYTSFATIDIKPPFVTGTLWLELNAIETVLPVDQDGDGQYTASELQAIRRPAKAYLDQRLLMLWEGQVHPFEVDRLDVAKRAGTGRSFLRVRFLVRDLPPGAPLEIVSRLLHDVVPTASCVALITRPGQAEVFVLGPRDYYRSQRARAPKAPDSAFRPRSQRGRIIVVRGLCLEALYAEPEGSFHLYFLEDDCETPRGFEAKPITAEIRPGGTNGKPTTVVLAPSPLDTDKPGHCSRFFGAAPQFKEIGVEAFSTDIKFGSGSNRRRLVFEFPVVTVLPEEEAEKAMRRYACPSLCLGVESKSASDTCMRCGSQLVEAHGAAIPGVGQIGRHGGELAELYPSRLRLEALLPRPKEVRFYLTDGAMKPQSVGDTTGKVSFGSGQQADESRIEVGLVTAKDGTYLFAEVPENLGIPLTAQCFLDFGEGGQPESATFLLHEIISLGD